MRERDSSLPAVAPAGPGNPLGTHALYLSWQYYRIHGTHDTRKIGRPSSDGCIGLYNEHIAKLYALVETGTQVRLIRTILAQGDGAPLPAVFQDVGASSLSSAPLATLWTAYFWNKVAMRRAFIPAVSSHRDAVLGGLEPCFAYP